MSRVLPLVMFAVATVYYGYELIIRIMPSVMIPELMESFQLSARSLGMLSSSFYTGYLLTTLVSGLCLDYYGTRKVMISACSLCVAGMFCFTFSHHVLLAEIARLAMGAGGAFAFIGAMKVGFDWLPAHWLGRLLGCLTFVGMLSAVSGQSILGQLILLIDWHIMCFIFSCMGLIVLLLFVIFLKDKPVQQNHQEQHQHFQQLITETKQVIANKQFWVLGLIGLFTYIPIAGFADLWCIQYLQQSYHIDRATSAYYSSLIFFGWGLGGPFFGLLNDYYHDWKRIIFAGMLLASMCIAMPLYFNVQANYLPICLFALGFFASSHIVVFIGAKGLGNASIAATVVALVNFMIMLSGAFIQPLIGVLLDLRGNFQFALSVLPFGLLFSIYLLSFIEETPYETSPLPNH